MAFPLGSVGAGFFHGLTGNIEEARQGQTEKAKLLGQLLGLGSELPEDIRSQIAPFASPESRMSEVMGGLGLTSAPREDLNRLTGLAARAQGYLSSIPLQKERMAGENLKAYLGGTTPTNFDFSVPSETNPLPDENRPLALVPPPKVDLPQTTGAPNIPQNLRTYLGLEPNAETALKTIGQYILREPQKNTVTNIRPGGEAVVTNPSGEVVSRIKGPEQEKMPPSMTEQQALAIEGKVNRNVPLNQRDLAIIGTDDPAQAKAVVQEMARIRKDNKVDSGTAMVKALAAFKQTQMTGRESQLFRFNDQTGQIEDAVSVGMPEAEALKNGFRKVSPDDNKTIKRGEAALESLDDFEASARKVLSKDPGIANMTWQQLETWFKNKQSDPDVVLFQTQMSRSLPLMLQSLGLSSARAGVRMLEIEKAALPNSAMTLGAALKLLDRDRKTIHAVQKAGVSGTFGKRPIGGPSGGESETADDVRRRLGLPSAPTPP